MEGNSTGAAVRKLEVGNVYVVGTGGRMSLAEMAWRVTGRPVSTSKVSWA